MGDDVHSWALDMAAELRQQATAGQQVSAVDWSREAGNLFRASVQASRIGRQLAEQVWQQHPQLRHSHFIAHSAGSFMAYAYCRQIKHLNPAIQVTTTYLDPASVHRGFDWNYGLRHFGDCADHSEVLFHRGDGVPGSEEPLPQAHSLDVTAYKPADWHNGHLWPVQYYRQRIQATARPPSSP